VSVGPAAPPPEPSALLPGGHAWPAPAKLNLFLHITGRRPDGYHTLRTVFRLLDWGDTVHVRVRPDGAIRRHGPDPGWPEDADLAVRAARALQAATGCPLGVDLRVEKRIPHGGGFGGGSSDAATVLRVLDRAWGTGLGPDALASIGLALGADVPVFVHGHNAWAEGLGERLTPLELPPAWYLVVDPGVVSPTAALFQAPDLTREAPAATMRDFLSGALRGNAFAPVLRQREPSVDRTLSLLSRFGEACLTGSGAGCFVAFATRAEAEAALQAWGGGPRAWVAAGVARSPLLDRLGVA
jgi:4-diphosphocytidyl-2-C-methyl-D-erythritol kinase